jgi:hypothetical protein
MGAMHALHPFARVTARSLSVRNDLCVAPYGTKPSLYYRTASDPLKGKAKLLNRVRAGILLDVCPDAATRERLQGTHQPVRVSFSHHRRSDQGQWSVSVAVNGSCLHYGRGRSIPLAPQAMVQASERSPLEVELPAPFRWFV